MLKSLTNYKTILAIVAQVGLIVGVVAPSVDWDAITVIATAVATILVLMGVVNRKGMETTKMNK